jgi:hypothetical protein
VGQITRGELKRRIPHGNSKYLLGTVVYLIDSDLTYKFWNMARSSHGVFVSKNQTKVTSPPLYFRSLCCQLPRITNPIP